MSVIIEPLVTKSFAILTITGSHSSVLFKLGNYWNGLGNFLFSMKEKGEFLRVEVVC